MKKIVAPLLLLSVVVLTSGCISQNVSTASAPLRVNLIANDLKADVTVGEKISGQAKVTYFLGMAFGSTNKYADGVAYDGASASLGGDSFLALLNTLAANTMAAKAEAAYDAISKSNADIIISPRYVLDVQDFLIFRTVEAKVTGYKGTVKNIR